MTVTLSSSRKRHGRPRNKRTLEDDGNQALCPSPSPKRTSVFAVGSRRPKLARSRRKAAASSRKASGKWASGGTSLSPKHRSAMLRAKQSESAGSVGELGTRHQEEGRAVLALQESDDEGDERSLLSIGTFMRKGKQKALALECSSDEEESVEGLSQRSIDKLLSNRDGMDGEYLIKWKGISYWHLEWVSRTDLEPIAGAKQRIKRYWATREDVIAEQELAAKRWLKRDTARYEKHLSFDPCLAEVDRIVTKHVYIDHRGLEANQYLCKWKTLPYDEGTWETENDMLDHGYEEALRAFSAREELPPKKERMAPIRPSAAEFKADLRLPSFKSSSLKLHDYQEAGVRWLISCWYADRSSILADEMGLGKTIQTVAMLHYLHKVHLIRGPFLVVVPLSTLEQWKREFETWSDLNVVTLHGGKRARELIIEHEFKYATSAYARKSDRKKADARMRQREQEKCHPLFKFNVLLATYESVNKEHKALSPIEWQYMVIDEGHRMKTTSSVLFKTLNSFYREQALILTGTPLQNNVKELWSMLHFLEGAEFDNYETFEEKYGQLTDHTGVERLQKRLAPYMLRRMKEDVFSDLPSKEETIIEIDLTTVQKTFYRAILEKNRAFLCAGGSSSNAPNLINIMMELRKCCNHPFLISGAEDKIVQKHYDILPDDAKFDPSGLSQEEVELRKSDIALLHSSSKLIVLDKLLAKLRAEGHRVLIFSQMTRVLDLLGDYLEVKDYPFERLDGSVSQVERQKSIDRFSDKSFDNFVFLLSTRAGGLGLNLTVANTVVIFDSDWNPQNDLQAQARSHRIGQTEDVMIYRLVTKNTYEEYMLEVASKKLGLERAVLSSSDSLSASSSAQVNADEMDRLLKMGAYHMFAEDEESQRARDQIIATEDIEYILANRAKKMNFSGGEKQPGRELMSGLSTVTYHLNESKDGASRKASSVSLTDTDFWAKILPDFKTAEVLLKQLTEEETVMFSRQAEGAAPMDEDSSSTDQAVTSLASREAQVQFLKSTWAVIENLKEATEEKGEFYNFSNTTEIAQLRDLLNAIRTSEHFFTENERSAAGSELSKLQGSKRKRKRPQNLYDGDLYMEPEAKKKKSKKDKKNPSKKKSRNKDSGAALEERTDPTWDAPMSEEKSDTTWEVMAIAKDGSGSSTASPNNDNNLRKSPSSVIPAQQLDALSTAMPRLQDRSLSWKAVNNFLSEWGFGRWEQHRAPHLKENIRAMGEQVVQQLYGPLTTGEVKLVVDKTHKEIREDAWRLAYGQPSAAQSTVPTSTREHPPGSKADYFSAVLHDGEVALLLKVREDVGPPTIEGEAPPFSIHLQGTPEMCQPGDNISVDMRPVGDIEEGLVVYLIVRLISDDKEVARGEIVRAFDVSDIQWGKEAVGIACPGFVGKYRIQAWCPTHPIPHMNAAGATFEVGFVHELKTAKKQCFASVQVARRKIEAMTNLRNLVNHYHLDAENLGHLVDELSEIISTLETPSDPWTPKMDAFMLLSCHCKGYSFSKECYPSVAIHKRCSRLNRLVRLLTKKRLNQLDRK